MVMETLKTIWELFVAIWPFFAIVLIVGLLPRLIDFIFYFLRNVVSRLKNRKKLKLGKEWVSDRELIEKLRKMQPYEFEEYIAILFSKLGYSAKVVGHSHDGGFDVLAIKNGIEHYIQCKRYKEVVGEPYIRDFYGALAGKLVRGEGYFITTSRFTLEAKKFATGKPIELIDEFRLVELIKSTGQ